MLNEIISGISRALNETFGDGYEIYTDDVEQGLTEPCFFIDVLKPEQTPFVGTRALRRNPFDIHYFPKTPGDNAECYAVAEKLMFGLAYVVMADGDMIRGTNMGYEVVDKVLHFFVNYNMVVYQHIDRPTMETLTTTVWPKKG